MTKKIFHSIFLAASAVLFGALLIIMIVLYGYFTSIRKGQLVSQTALAAQGVEKEGLSYFEGLLIEGYRFTWVDADGAVLYDSEADASLMENHLDREEIREALQYGAGESERTSATLSEKTFYRAERLSDGTVLRASVTQYTIIRLAFGMAEPILMVLLVTILTSAFLAKRLARRIVGPLNHLDLDRPLENEAYEEVAPLLNRIEQQHRQIKEQVSALRKSKDEFYAVTGNMNEGLILLNEKGAVLSINPAAARLFQADAGVVGRDFLTVNRSLHMQELVFGALAGKHGEKIMELMDRKYRLHASPVISGGDVKGACLLLFDETDKVLLEERRREFSANVSHELKTPLHSIMGSAELIENGLVRPEDMPDFISRIRKEAGRLVSLIDDIIRLSELDEGAALPREETDLAELAREAEEALKLEAENKKVSVEIKGGPLPVKGVRRLLYEIVYNLLDNAIKYNMEGGKVLVSLSKSEESPLLLVEDTGIGIPSAHQQRVFERFYRVDASHSRETGGTGLGLSIVKHAVQLHKGVIRLESHAGKGTKIEITFPSEMLAEE